MAVLTEHIPENDRAGFAFEIGEPELLRALHDLWIIPAGLAHPGQVTFHVCHENGNAPGTEILGQCLECHRLARAGRAGDKAMTVRHFWQEINWFRALGDENWVVHNVPQCAKRRSIVEPVSRR